MKEEKIYFKNQGEKIEGILSQPENKSDSLIILVHGLASSRDGSGGLFIELTKRLIPQNFAVLRFNFRFTTEDFNEFHKMTIKGEVSDLKLIINKMAKKYSKIGLLGESLGGAISILSYNKKMKCLVLWYPCIFLRETILGKRFLSKNAIMELKEIGYIKGEKTDGREYKIGKNLIKELRTLDIIPFGKKIHSPILIIHGEKDTLVPFKQSEKFLKILREPKRLVKILGVCHAWENKDFPLDYNFKAQQKAIKLTIDWFKKWLK